MVAAGTPSALDSGMLEEARRTHRILVITRWVGVLFALLQVSTYATMPYPDGLRTIAYGIVAVLALGNVGFALATRRLQSWAQARRLSIMSLTFDAAVLMGIVWLYSFDALSALFVILFLVPIEGALHFQLRGALWSWAGASALYVFREVYATERYGHAFEMDSVTFRTGMMLLVAILVGGLARDLVLQRRATEEALSDARRVEQWRGRLVAMLAHDVRSPLGTIRTSLSLLDQRADRLSAEQIHMLTRGALRQADRLLLLSSDLLDLARREDAQLLLELDHVDVSEMIHGAIEVVTDGQDPEIEIDVPEGLSITADPARLEQILVNLLTNAVRHGSPPIHIRARSREGGVQLTVRDHGQGIPDERRDTLFDPFAKGAAPESVGLGLWVIHQLADAHGGTVQYRPADPGAEFAVDLPEGVGEPSVVEREEESLRQTG